jgi:hypothetical protein
MGRLPKSGPRRGSSSGWRGGPLAVAHRRCRPWWQLSAAAALWRAALQQVPASLVAIHMYHGTLCMYTCEHRGRPAQFVP